MPLIEHWNFCTYTLSVFSIIVRILSLAERLQWRNVAVRNRCLFMWSVYFCMGAYKRDVVVVIKMGAYIHGVLIFYGCLITTLALRIYGSRRYLFQ